MPRTMKLASLFCLLAPVLSFAGTLNFNGTITTLNAPVSNMELLASAGFGPLPLLGTCAANSTCPVSASLDVPFFPIFGLNFAVMGFYSGGPNVFVVTSSTFTPSGGGFLADFSFNETTMSGHITSGWTDQGAFVDNIEFLTFPGHSADFMHATALGGTINGNLWDYTTGTANGGVSLQTAFVSAPEPSTAIFLASALLLAAFKLRRRPSLR